MSPYDFESPVAHENHNIYPAQDKVKRCTYTTIENTCEISLAERNKFPCLAVEISQCVNVSSSSVSPKRPKYFICHSHQITVYSSGAALVTEMGLEKINARGERESV